MRKTLSLIFVIIAVFWAVHKVFTSEAPRARTDRFGVLVNLPGVDETAKPVYLFFTADSMFEGAGYALDVMRDRNVKASFFFTGNFLRDSLRNDSTVRRVIADGHYVGGHGDRHLQLAEWDADRTALIGADSAVTDMLANYALLGRYGVTAESAPYVVPSFEWCNASHSSAFIKKGFTPIGPSPGFLTYRDYTTPDMGDEYYPSETIWHDFLRNVRTRDINGTFVLIHLGTQDVRTDKFYHYLPRLIDTLRAHGYSPQRLYPSPIKLY